MEEQGFSVRVGDAADFAAVKSRYNVPADLQACHTAIVDGYVVEGHVPADDVRRLLDERPNVVGIAVPGMPLGSPGMEQEGVAAQAYDVLAFDQAGNTTVWASYPAGE